MAEPSVHGAIHHRSSGGRPNRIEGDRPPPSLSPRDLISDLPDAVIHHIFSFLPFKDVLKTSAFSKRWRFTWTATTHLEFNGVRPCDPDASSLDFPSFIDSVLSQCTSPTVKKLHITDFKYNEDDRPKIDLWLLFATERHVEDLRLLITERWFTYVLPPFFFCSSWLVRVEIGRCCFSLGETISWPRLKFLSIEDAVLGDDILEGILKGSPVLESVELHRCSCVKNITIDSSSVKSLVITDSEKSIVERIWAPHLLSLRVSGTWRRNMFRLDNISSLVEAELVFNIRIFLPYEQRMCYDLLMELIQNLGGVPTITIGDWCLKIMSLFEMEGVPYPLSCQNMILHAPVNQWDLLGIAYMLESSPCLEKLVLHLTGSRSLKYKLYEESKDRFNYDEEDFLCSRKENFQCLAKHLKIVEIIGFKAISFGSKHLLTLIKFLLGNTLALEKMIIKADLHARNGQKHTQVAVPSKLLGLSQSLLSYRRASENADVIFTYSFK